MAEHSELLKIIALIFKWQPEEIKALAEDLLEQRKAIWRDTIEEEARKVGCQKRANDPRLTDLQELRIACKGDADSIAATWARDVDRQLLKLYKANPRGNRHYYIKNMNEWAYRRGLWKNAQIGLVTNQTTRYYAQQRFRAENDINTRFVYAGPAPVSQGCIRRTAAGVVSAEYVRRNPTPNHPNCPHEWQALSYPRLECSEVWVG
jgi:hypothetical protein